MDQTPQQRPGAHFAGPLEYPFSGWPNSDLLIEEEDRAFFARHYPQFAPIFDWPELRALFLTYDTAAASARKHSRRWGILAIITGFVSLIIVATLPLVDELTRGNLAQQSRLLATVGGFGAVLAIVSVLMGYTQVLTGKEKTRWLTNRFWTERIRQLHFQLIVTHVPQVIAAVGSEGGLQAWLDYRATELDQFKHDYLRGVEERIYNLDLDEAEDSPWLNREWELAAALPGDSPDLELFLRLMERQRFQIQQRYAEKKLRRGWRSPKSGSEWVMKLSDTLTAVLLLATITSGVGSIVALALSGNARLHLIPALVAAVASACIVAMRALKEGLLLSADAERYRWYLASVATLHRRYEQAPPAQKIHLLCQLEHAAYKEMRRFMLSGAEARFVM